MKKYNLYSGISLIVLVITIIVIIILAGAIILSISQNNPANSASEATFKSSIQAYNDHLSLYLANKYASDSSFIPSTVSFSSWTSGSTTGTIKELIPNITDSAASKYAVQSGKLVYVGSDASEITLSSQINILDSQIANYDSSKGVNKPILATGMTPVKWVGTNLTTTTENDTSWYSYDTTNKMWANAQTADGSVWVWIPRFIYKISSGWHTNTIGTIEVQFSKGIYDNWNSAVIGNIDSGSSASSSNNKWTNQPAFTFGNAELTGIWVAKFEANNNGSKIKIGPDLASWRNISIDNCFTYCRNMENDNSYGWTSNVGIDTHLMKNVEWGAVTYLTKSVYGKNNSKVWINPDSNQLTGRAGTSVGAVETTITYSYNDLTYGVQASTTGNVYGIYDLSGGAGEYTAGYLNNSFYIKYYGNRSLYKSEAKYKEVYESSVGDVQANNYLLASSSKGDAIYETTGTATGNTWFGDVIYMPVGNLSVYIRGGRTFYTNVAGLFSYYGEGPGGHSQFGFRPTLVVAGSI